MVQVMKITCLVLLSIWYSRATLVTKKSKFDDTNEGAIDSVSSSKSPHNGLRQIGKNALGTSQNVALELVDVYCKFPSEKP